MNLVVSRVGAALLLDALLDNVDLWYHLYVSDCPPHRYSERDDFKEASWDGYFPQPVKHWDPAELSNGHAFATADPLLWTRGTLGIAQTVRGYFVTSGQNGPYVFGQAADDDQVIPMEIDGESVAVFPYFSDITEFDPQPMFCGGVAVGGE